MGSHILEKDYMTTSHGNDANNDVRYLAPFTSQALATAETNRKLTSEFRGRAKKLKVYVITNAKDGNTVVAFRINGSDAISVTVPANTTGEFSTDGDALFLPGDGLSFKEDKSASTNGSNFTCCIIALYYERKVTK